MHHVNLSQETELWCPNFGIAPEHLCDLRQVI